MKPWIWGRIGELAGLAWYASRIPGAFVECGAENGFSASVIAHNSRHPDVRHVWLFDSWQGLPKPTEQDGPVATSSYESKNGLWCVGSMKVVREAFDSIGWPEDHLHLIPGWFADTLSSVEPGPIAILHLDADWYESTKLALERFYDDVVPGGAIRVDDYYHWPGCREAVDEFLSTRSIDARACCQEDVYWYMLKAGK